MDIYIDILYKYTYMKIIFTRMPTTFDRVWNERKKSNSHQT